MPPLKVRGVRLLYCGDPCRRRARVERRHAIRRLQIERQRRRCVGCSVVISFLDLTWIPTAAMCQHHLDLAHCADHCTGVY